MRRKPGIAGIQATQASQARASKLVATHALILTRAAPQSHYRSVGAAATETAQAHMVERLAQFKSSLEAFALKYRCVRETRLHVALSPRPRTASLATLTPC
jgi:hypothetical protein